MKGRRVGDYCYSKLPYKTCVSENAGEFEDVGLGHGPWNGANCADIVACRKMHGRRPTAGADVDKSTEIDLTQRAARSEGRSPAALLVSTFSDQLAIHTGGNAKIFGVSVKDRGAVTMAGHAGKAFWFSKAITACPAKRFFCLRRDRNQSL